MSRTIEQWKETHKCYAEINGDTVGAAMLGSAVEDLEALQELANNRYHLLVELALEYVEQLLPGIAGYGVRQKRIASGRAASAAVNGQLEIAHGPNHRLPIGEAMLKGGAEYQPKQKPACPPCNGNCNQGRDCPAATRGAK